MPSARLAPIEIQAEFGPIPTCMIPLDSWPALHHIARPFSGTGFDTVVAVEALGGPVDSHTILHPELKARPVAVGQTRSLGETVHEALRQLPQHLDALVINFGDTLVPDPPMAGDVVCYAEQEDSYRWTTFQEMADGSIGGVVDKEHEKPEGMAKVFVGCFAIQEPARFRHLLAAALAQGGATDPFYAAVMAYFRAAPPSRRLQHTPSWMDLGHLDTYYAAKRRLFLSRRHFNAMEVDPRRGLVRKTSQDEARLREEIGWYLRLPAGLQHVAPRVLGHGLDPPWMTLEFYGYPVLQDVYLYGRRDGGYWERVLVAIGHLLDDFASAPAKVDAETARAACREMYETKTRERLLQFLETQAIVRPDRQLSVNGRQCPSVEEVLASLPKAVAAHHLADMPPMGLIHGDLCLGNILYDARNQFVRVVDPRGRFGALEGAGDRRYDLAKLSHSFLGDYDFLLNGLCTVRVEGQEATVEPALAEQHRTAKRLFTSWLARRAPGRVDEVRLIESLLFLSMLPLHKDNPRAQLAFLLRGLHGYSGFMETTG